MATLIFRNLLPARVRVFDENEKIILDLEPEKVPARVTRTYELADYFNAEDTFGSDSCLPIYDLAYGKVVDLPAPKLGVFYIVSSEVKEYALSRRDLLSPAIPMRGNSEKLISCIGLVE